MFDFNHYRILTERADWRGICEQNGVRKGDGLIANCIGRGLSLGTYSADKCSVKHIYKKEQMRK
jgi:hypothetical protein